MRVATFATTVCAAALMTGAASGATITIAHGLGPTHLYSSHGITPFIQCVTEATGGSVEFQEFGSGQIVTLPGALDALTGGITQMTNVVTSYESGKLPIANALLMPGMAPDGVTMHRAYREVLDQPDNPAAKEWADLGLVPIIGIIGGGYQLFTTGAPVDTMEKLAGAKIRAGGGVQVLTLEAVGASSIDMAIGDLYVAMQRGTVDGTILGVENAPAYKLEELVKSVSTNGALGYGQSVVAITQEAFDTLAPEEQEAFRDCGKKVETDLGAFIDNRVAEIQQEWSAQGITFYEFPEEMLAELNARAASVADRYITDLENRGVVGAREALESFKEAQAN